MGDSTALAGGRQGHERLAELIPLVLQGLAAGTAERAAPGPAGGPAPVAASVAALEPLVPARGVGAEKALSELTALLAAGSVDPADPWCAAHLHCPPLAVGVAADVAAGALNPSMDSWDQAPVASELERAFLAAIARQCYPGASEPDAVVTTGGTESNLLALLLAREHQRQPVCGRNAHHSVARAAWVLGLRTPLLVECDGERMIPASLDAVLRETGPAVVVATAGTTNAGEIDPLRELARICRRHGARLHVDAAYGGLALCSETLRPLLDGIDQADTIALDMHKFGWQSVAAGLFAVREAADLKALTVRAEYLNADDDTEAGLPDLLGRSIRTSRRPDAFRMAVTMRALGIDGVGELVERCCATAREVADAVRRHPALELWGEPTLSTVLFRPRFGDVARVRRALLETGTAIVGRATMAPGEVWLKLTLLHPHASAADYLGLLDAVAARAQAPEGAVAS
ncbi:pyridoxal phosphate-dependent decarboxylase family protein [Amycolatopsis alkalitolerans]|uniref:Aspartate aminotransferase family protein n=1 Tax=Amycolatopsis alkalitolerans TaxID=2547244 RepID=A0A5C4M3T3_9PSEU|nr:aminotransferase class V-fold PLP-dependent enzyme [Amycolatopsis alkalitolerans]TNC27715.1 aspartate aminotransferase family protein [Amycolatopsis alkalitolerans]